MRNLNLLIRPYVLVATMVAITLAVGAPRARAERTSPQPYDENETQTQLSQEVYRQLMDLPFFTVFDNLQYRVEGSEVTLLGQTANVTLRIDAENMVKSIPGVTQVHNDIELLPVSRMDQRIRFEEYRAIYSEPTLQKYGEGSYPSIHIIVKYGHVTLVGTVNNAADKQIAGTRALEVPDVFSVQNDLQVKSSS
jgi:BON domain